jgi:hypothetical protein
MKILNNLFLAYPWSVILTLLLSISLCEALSLSLLCCEAHWNNVSESCFNSKCPTKFEPTHIPTHLTHSPLPVAYSLHIQEWRGGGAVRGEGAKSRGPVYFVFCRLCPSCPQPTRSCLAPPVIFLLLTNTEPPVRACQSIWLERFCESQKKTSVFNPLWGEVNKMYVGGLLHKSYTQYSVWLMIILLQDIVYKTWTNLFASCLVKDLLI